MRPRVPAIPVRPSRPDIVAALNRSPRTPHAQEHHDAICLACGLYPLISGCSPLAERQVRDAQFVGKPETSLVGIMEHTWEDGVVRFLTYEDRRFDTVPGARFCFSSGPFCGGGSFPPPRLATLAYDSAFLASGGLVRAFSLRGNGCA